MDKRKRKIILVDDVNFHLVNTKNRLKEHYEIYPAQDAEILFEILENIVPELILLDINIPKIDGFEILKMLKSDARYFEIPVIFFTGNKNKANIIKGMTLGAVDFITKPFKDSDVIESIENQLDPEKRKKNRPIVLTVDDSPSILREINTVLKEQYIVYGLPSPENATELLETITPDIFILDYQMPAITGFDLVPIIRAIPEHEKTPIVFLTSEGTFNNLSKAIELGASDFLVKPIDPPALREKIALYLVDYLLQRQMRTLKFDFDD